jgi:hypothetical protein
LAEIVFPQAVPQAVIPTTSLFPIEELVGDKLDGYIYELEAKSASAREQADHQGNRRREVRLPDEFWAALLTYP